MRAFRPKLLVFSDYVCPFCYLALSLVERLSLDYDMDVVWRNYEIHPQTPPNGIQLVEASAEAETESRLLRELNTELSQRIRQPPFLANSHLAHEAAEFAHEQGHFAELHRSLFRAYFEEGRNIGEPSVLVELGTEASLDPAALHDAILTHRYHSRIEQVIREKLWYGIVGTPTFVLGRYKIIGPQPYDYFQNVLERIGAQPHGAG